MSLQTPQEIDQFLLLQKKSDLELRAILEGMKLSTEGNRTEMVRRLLSLKIDHQNDVTAHQVIPLRTTKDGMPIEGAIEFLQKARAFIFRSPNSPIDFFLLNSKGEKISIKMKYCRLSEESLRFMIERDMFFPQPNQRELVSLVKTSPNRFIFHIVNKPSAGGKTFIMVHCQPKAA